MSSATAVPGAGALQRDAARRTETPKAVLRLDGYWQLYHNAAYREITPQLRLHTLTQPVLLELMRSEDGAHLPAWSKDDALAVPFASASAQHALSYRAVNGSWGVTNEGGLAQRPGGGPSGVHIAAPASASARGSRVALTRAQVEAGEITACRGAARGEAYLQLVALALDASAALKALLAAPGADQERVLLDALVPVLAQTQVAWRLDRKARGRAEAEARRLKEAERRGALRSQWEALLTPVEEYAREMLDWRVGDPMPTFPAPLLDRAGSMYKLLRAVLPVKDQTSKRARRAARAAEASAARAREAASARAAARSVAATDDGAGVSGDDGGDGSGDEQAEDEGELDGGVEACARMSILNASGVRPPLPCRPHHLE